MSDFWSRRLGNGRPAPRQEVAQPQPQQYQQQAPQSVEPSLAPPQAAHLRDTTGHCPNCGPDGDYVQAPGMAKPRCYTCGYPVLHSTSGVVATDRRKAKPARQLKESMEGGYNPHVIVGRIE